MFVKILVLQVNFLSKITFVLFIILISAFKLCVRLSKVASRSHFGFVLGLYQVKRVYFSLDLCFHPRPSQDSFFAGTTLPQSSCCVVTAFLPYLRGGGGFKPITWEETILS